MVGRQGIGRLALMAGIVAMVGNLVADSKGASWPLDLDTSDDVLTELVARGYRRTADLLGCPVCLGFHLAWVVTGIGGGIFGFEMREWVLCFGISLLVQRLCLLKK